jgi:hypothetical protein
MDGPATNHPNAPSFVKPFSNSFFFSFSLCRLTFPRFYHASFSPQARPPADVRLSAHLPPFKLTHSFAGSRTSGNVAWVLSYSFLIEPTCRLILYGALLNAILEFESDMSSRTMRSQTVGDASTIRRHFRHTCASLSHPRLRVQRLSYKGTSWDSY